MRLIRFSSAQYAGIRGASADFSAGINVLLGDNEAGKSTLIGALLSVLTKPSRLDKRMDRAFIEREFPKNGADTIDASLSFEKDGQEYKIAKIWDRKNAESRSELVLPNLLVYRGDEADSALASLISLSPGLMRNLVFVRQDAEKEILEWCYGFFDEGLRKGDDGGIAEARRKISEAFSAAGGISEEKLKNLLMTEIAAVGGHWDIRTGAPEGGRGLENRWSKGVGTLLKAYYAYKEAEKALNDANLAENELARNQKRLSELTKVWDESAKRLEEMRRQYSFIESRDKTAKLRDECQKAVENAETAKRKWPVLVSCLARARELEDIKRAAESFAERARLLKLSDEQKKLDAEIEKLAKEKEALAGIREDAEKALALSVSARQAEATLGAVKLHLSLQMENGKSAVLACENGEKVLSGSTETDISGALRLSVDGVMHLVAAPQGMDVSAIESARDKAREALSEILSRRGAADIPALNALVRRTAELDSMLFEKRLALKNASSEGDASELISKAEALPAGKPAPQTLEGDIAALIGRTQVATLPEYIAKCVANLEASESLYGSADKLELLLSQKRAELLEYEKQLSECKNAPDIGADEFAGRINALKRENDARAQERESLMRESGRLSALAGGDVSELSQREEEARSAFELLKQRYADLLTISKDFEELRQDNSARFDNFNRRFADNLSVITGGEVGIDTDGGLSLVGASGRLTMPELLSQGTKKTLLLAFRLAVLSCFFPAGGGLAVMDDELLDMDPSRRAMAAELISRFAEDNQVIFATCDPAVAELLNGNTIAIEKHRFQHQ